MRTLSLLIIALIWAPSLIAQVQSANPNDSKVEPPAAEKKANNPIRDSININLKLVEAEIAKKPSDLSIRILLIIAHSKQHPPDWKEIDRIFEELYQMKEFENDIFLRHYQAKLYVLRNLPNKAFESIKQAILLGKQNPDKILPLMEDYLDILLRLKKYKVTIAECDGLLRNATLAKQGWWVYRLRGIAVGAQDPQSNKAMPDFDKAMDIVAELKNFNAMDLILQSIAKASALLGPMRRPPPSAPPSDSLAPELASRQQMRIANRVDKRTRRQATLCRITGVIRQAAFSLIWFTES